MGRVLVGKKTSWMVQYLHRGLCPTVKCWCFAGVGGMVDKVGRIGRPAGLARLAGRWCGRVGAPVDVHWLLDTSPLAVPPFPLAPFFSRPCLVVGYV